MAKGTSFAEKAKKGAKKEKKFTVVKYIKSVVAEKSGAIRFQESLLKIPEDKNLDSYLKELEAGPIEEAPVEAAEEEPSEDAPASEEAPVEAAEEEPSEDAEPKEKTES